MINCDHKYFEENLIANKDGIVALLEKIKYVEAKKGSSLPKDVQEFMDDATTLINELEINPDDSAVVTRYYL